MIVFSLPGHLLSLVFDATLNADNTIGEWLTQAPLLFQVPSIGSIVLADCPGQYTEANVMNPQLLTPLSSVLCTNDDTTKYCAAADN